MYSTVRPGDRSSIQGKTVTFSSLPAEMSQNTDARYEPYDSGVVRRRPGRPVEQTLPPISRVPCTYVTPSSGLTFSSADSNLSALEPSYKAPVNSHEWQYLPRTQVTQSTPVRSECLDNSYSHYLPPGMHQHECKITALCIVTHTVLLTWHLMFASCQRLDEFIQNPFLGKHD